jgi:phosphoglycolate phosphatase-like HAD superfamily hydrolase
MTTAEAGTLRVVGPQVRHIVWDWNGTLLDDGGALIAATVDALHACGFPPITRADYQRHHCQPIPLFYERLAGRALGLQEQQRLEGCFREAYARHRQADLGGTRRRRGIIRARLSARPRWYSHTAIRPPLIDPARQSSTPAR